MTVKHLWLLFVHTLLGVDSVTGESSYCSSGFPERDRLVNDVVSLDGPAIILIPEMNFTCNGTITGFTFAGRYVESGDLNPVIQIWRENSSQPGEYYRTGADIRINEGACVDDEFNQVFDGVFHCDLIGTAQQAVQPGDILGLELAPEDDSDTDLLFARVLKGPVNYVFNGAEQLPSVILSNRDSENQDLPQIAINVSESECTRGFPSIPVFEEESIAEDSNVVTVVIPDMSFTCNQRIVAFTFAGSNTRGEQDPVIQIWRENSSEPGTYYKTGCSIPVNISSVVCADGLPTVSSRTFFCILNKEYQISVQAGDILGLEIPPLNNDDFDIFFTRGGPTNYVFNQQVKFIYENDISYAVPQLPQISFRFTSDQCTSGFPDTVSAEGSGQGDPSKVTTRIFPELRFGCSGKIVRFAVAVVNRNGRQSPKFQIWRPNDTQPDIYYKIAPGIRIFESRSMCLRHRLTNGVFRCTLNEAFQVSVQPGDILGLELPPENDDDFKISFTDEGPVNYIFEDRLNSTVNLSEASKFTSHMPQINFVVALGSEPLSEGDGSTCGFTPVLPDNATTGSVPALTTTGSLPTSIAQKAIVSITAGSVVGSSIVLLLLVGFLLAAVCICRHRKTKRSQDKLVLTIMVDNNEAYGTSNYIGVGNHNKFITVESNKACGTSNHIGPDDHVKSNKAYGVLAAQEILSQQELGDGASQMYMYDYPITEIETQGGFPGPNLNEPAVEDDTYWEPADDANELYQQLSANKYRDIKSSQIQITQALGNGQFGEVSKGIWQSPMGAMDVAVKQLQPGASEEENIRFLQEAAINGQFRHPNVVKLMGVVTAGGPTMIVLELLSNGDLLNFLINKRPSSGEAVPVETQQMLLRFCQHVVSGMGYLASKSFIHRDLAARNILVSEDKICKISDFGMSRDVESDKCYISKGGKIPVKWTAPEALYYKKYSTASDVWSFGCVMYEIWSLGHEPFEHFTNTETFRRVEMGYRLPPPPGLTKELYKIMIQCWKPESSRRPTFPQLVEMLSRADFELFAWEEEDLKDSDPQVKLIGAPLEVAQDLYPELQRSYAK